MRYMAIVLALSVQACTATSGHSHPTARSIEAEDPEAPPGSNEIKAAVIHDIRVRRQLLSQLEKGSRSPPSGIRLDSKGVQAVRTKDQAPLWRIVVREESQELVSHPMFEIAYWDNDASTYVYHCYGGNPYLHRWLGPFEINPKINRPDSSDH